MQLHPGNPAAYDAPAAAQALRMLCGWMNESGTWYLRGVSFLSLCGHGPSYPVRRVGFDFVEGQLRQGQRGDGLGAEQAG